MMSVVNHMNGAKNPNAQFRNEITVDKVLNSSPVADPSSVGLFGILLAYFRKLTF